MARVAESALDRARLLAARGESDAALDALDRLLAEDPEQPQALMLKASLLLEARAGEAALALARRAARLAPDSAEAHNELARCLHALGRNQEALAEAESARRLLSRDENHLYVAPVYLTLVWVLRDMRRFREALELAEEGLLRTPDAVLAEWADVVQRELIEAERERC